EQHDALERRLVELARVAWRGLDIRVMELGLGEHHAPGQRGRPSEQLAVDEIRDAAEEQPDRHGGGAKVHGAPAVDAIAPREGPYGDDAAEEGAVERHAAHPYLVNILRVRQVVARLVEQHEAEASAEHDAGGYVQEEIIDLSWLERRLVVGPQPRLAQQPPD